MAILQYRKLASEAEAGLTTIYNCTSCDDYSPPPAAAAAASPDESAAHTNHAIPYMVSAACVLGVAFLLLTTCTILLRHRWSRLRSSRRVASTSRDSDEDQSPVDHPIWHIVTVGLPQSVIDSITAVSYKSRDGVVEGSDCSVCLTRFEDGDGVRLLPKCGHAFHLPCIDTWLRSHKNCPLCRAPVVNDSNPNSGPSENPREETAAADDNDDSDTSPVVNEDFQPVRRSISLDSPAAYEYECAVNKANVVIDVGLQNGEGSSKQQSMAEDGGDSAISRMMKRSLSSSAKILSPFRGSKSQSSSSSSTLPL